MDAALFVKSVLPILLFCCLDSAKCRIASRLRGQSYNLQLWSSPLVNSISSYWPVSNASSILKPPSSVTDASMFALPFARRARRRSPAAAAEQISDTVWSSPASLRCHWRHSLETKISSLGHCNLVSRESGQGEISDLEVDCATWEWWKNSQTPK